MKRIAWSVLLVLALPWSARADDPSWDIEVGLDNSIYPSLIIATSTMVEDEEDEPDPTMLGDAWGLIGVTVEAPANRTPVRVEISSSRLIQPSVWEGVLEKKGETYFICPLLKFDYEALLAIRQPFPEIVTARLTLNGRLLPEKSKRVPVRSINDCILAFADENEEVTDISWLIAAYVNENHPVVDELLAEALNAGYVESFAGYQKKARDVKKEMKAIYRAIQDRGFKYSNITRGSGESRNVAMQHIRLLGDQVRGAQANCVEGSVLFASVFRKLEMDPFLVMVPGHLFVGVFLDEDQEDYLCIETTMVGDSTFEEAVKAGNSQFEEAAPYLLEEEAGEDDQREKKDEEEEEDASDYMIIDIATARQLGIMPIREAAADDPHLRAVSEAARRPRPAPDRPTPPASPSRPDRPTRESGMESVRIAEFDAVLLLPEGWNSEVEEDSAGDPLFTASNDDEDLVVNVGVLPTEGRSAAALLRTYVKGLDLSMKGSVEQLEVSGLPAALGEASGKLDGSPVRVTVLVAVHGKKAYLVQALGIKESYDEQRDTLLAIVRSFRFR